MCITPFVVTFWKNLFSIFFSNETLFPNGKILEKESNVYGWPIRTILYFNFHIFLLMFAELYWKKRLFKCEKVPDFLIKREKGLSKHERFPFFSRKEKELTQLHFEESSYECKISSSEFFGVRMKALSTRWMHFTRSQVDEMQKYNTN